MKKLFTLLVMALCTMGVGAQTAYTFESYAGDYTSTTELSNGITIYATSKKKISIDGSNKTATVNGEEMSYTHRLKFGGTGASDRCISFEVNGSADITIVATSSSSDEDRTLNVYANAWGSDNLGEVSAPAGSLNVQTLSYSGDATTIYVGTASSGANIYGIYVNDKSGAPILSVSPVALSFSLSPINSVECDTVTLKGSNLEDGIYYVEQPGVSGMYINPESFTVENGTVEQDFEIMYMTDADVEKASADFIFNVGDASAKVTVTYQSRANMYDQELVTEATTWNWESLTGPEVQLTAETSPKRSPEVGVVMANLEDRITFNSDFTIEKAKQIVLINTQYPSRKKAMQNGMVKFTTNVAGTISVDFSDTGSSYSDSSPRYERYLNVNGVNTEFYTMRDGSKSDRKVAEGIAVEPGNVFIKARGVNPKDGNTEEADAAVMIYKITFTPDADAVADPSIEINDELAPAAGTATAIKNVTGERMMNNVRFNLAGQQVSKDYKGIVVRNGQKWMQK